MKVLHLILFAITAIGLNAQYDEIELINPSFEGLPAMGSYESSFQLGGWIDCAPYYFHGQTPPDVQTGTQEFFDVTTLPNNGETYLGMVTRQNETWELVSQRLANNLEKGKCYTFEIDLARSNTYISVIQDDFNDKEYNFNKPIVLRIWGGRNVYEKRELLAETPVIDHTAWKTYQFEFNVNQDHDYLILEAFYKTPTLLPYNGNVLLDNASQVIRQIACPGEEELLAVHEVKTQKSQTNKKTRKTQGKVSKNDKKKSNDDQLRQKDPDNLSKSPIKTSRTNRILTELDKATLKEGQTIKIEQLYFKADSSNFTPGSFAVLDEIYYFLNKNPGVVIEIGGHTNGIPGVKYCQELSLKRAKSVANYLYDKGIPEGRILYKGYGKQRPVASNKTYLGRQKNQRVEIKILKLS